ncbi:MAG: sporulation initiation factor Spo0A C-terminal domain-containing protein [Ruminococcus sp.]|nr:sporulation initiation factor Spo0A C-terminal domain-containing protein [Ruminococcus sp.]
MNGHLLICDNSPGLGRLLSRRFMNMGIMAECCKSSLSSIKSRISEGKICGIILFAFRPDEKLLDLIRQLSENGISVFAGLYTSSASVHDCFRRAGAEKCFIMPYPVSSLCCTVMLYADKGKSLLSRLELLIEELGFPRRLSGFYYLAKAAEIALDSPERLWGSMNGIYEEIAQTYSTKASLVERAMRNLADHALKSGASARLTEHRLTEKPTNTELICALCDLFSRL